MKKLEDIPKKSPFEVPDGYFDRLPSVIQSRVTETKKNKAYQWSFSVRYALPILILAGIGIFWFNNKPSVNSYEEFEIELESVQPDQLSIYLDDSDLSTEDLVETVTWSEEDLKDLEDHVYSTMEVTGDELEKVLDEYDIKL